MAKQYSSGHTSNISQSLRKRRRNNNYRGESATMYMGFVFSLAPLFTAVTALTATTAHFTIRQKSNGISGLSAMSLPSSLTLSDEVFTLNIPNYFDSYEADLYDDDDVDGEENGRYFFIDDSTDFVDSVSNFLRLQKSMGSDVLQAELQKQIDAGAALFLNNHVEDATELEKLAMSSVTEQLPKAAMKALTAKTQPEPRRLKKSNSVKPRNDLNFGSSRVTAQEEIQLARIIQLGSALHKIKQDVDDRLEREISKQEWANLAGIQSTRDLRRLVSDYRNAKHDLVQANLGLVHAVVKQQWHAKYKQTGISFEELVQEGSLGLIRAAELFDPTKGLRFSTYAVVWIKGTLQNNHLTELVKLPAREKSKWSKIVEASSNAQRNRRVEPTVEELASITGFSISEIVDLKRKMNQAKHIMSLDYQYSTQSRSGTESSKGGEGSLLSDRNLQDLNDEELKERNQFQADLIAAMARNLDPREARLMRLRYGLSEDGKTRTLHECADAMGLSYTRVNQLANRCLEKLRKAAEAESLEEYLLTVA